MFPGENNSTSKDMKQIQPDNDSIFNRDSDNYLLSKDLEKSIGHESPLSFLLSNSSKSTNAGYFTPPTSPDGFATCPSTPIHHLFKEESDPMNDEMNTFSSGRFNPLKKISISPTGQNNNLNSRQKKCSSFLKLLNCDRSKLRKINQTILYAGHYQSTPIPNVLDRISLNSRPFGPTPAKVLSINRNPYSPCDTSSSRPRIELPHDASPERLLLDFHLEQEIGKGSFGSVALCTHRMDGWSYAIKRLHFSSLNQRNRLINEVYLMAAFSHPNIVQYHSSWTDRSTIYIQMEYCSGGSLENWWRYHQDSNPTKNEAKLYKVIQHIALALDYLHTQKNVVHLDIKPANIFVQYQSSLHYCYKLGDFGSMRQIPLSLVSSSINEHTQATHEEIYGLNLNKIECEDIDEGDGRYLAPELLKEQVDLKLLGRADIYAVGCSILELAGGQLSFHPSEFEEDILNAPVLLPHGYSPDFVCLLSGMLSPDPSKRPSAHGLLMKDHPSHIDAPSIIPSSKDGP